MLVRRGKVKPPALEEPITREWMRERFPEARVMCDCPSRREVCTSSCDRFAHHRANVAKFFGWVVAAEVVGG